MRWTQVKSSGAAPGRSSSVGHRLRRLACMLAAGMLFQTTSGGCEAQLSQAIQAVAADIVNGVGTGVGNLAEAFVLNLFI